MPSFSGPARQSEQESQPEYDGDAMSQRVSNIKLPEKIRCQRCKKYKQHHAYSKKQLNVARFDVYSNKTRSADDRINCVPCTGGQVAELKCSRCNTIKGLEDFSKVQRRAGDEAKCNKCMDKQLQSEFHDSVEQGSDEDENYDHDDPYYNDNPDYPRLPGAQSSIGSDSEYPSTKESHTYSESWSRQYRPGREEEEQLSQEFNPQGYGHPLSRATDRSTAGTASSARSESSFSIEKSSKWAKVRPVKAKSDRPAYYSSSEDEGAHSEDEDD